MKFSRVGGLSSVKYKRQRYQSAMYHVPPTRHGIYAFIWPFFDAYFVAWHKEGKRRLEAHDYRVFEFEGHLYTHLVPENADKEECWFWVSTAELRALLRKDYHRLAIEKSKRQDGWFGRDAWKTAYRNARSGFSVDHLEVFIPRRELGRIR